ncbi:MAG: hypothetical protein ACPF9X_01580 [Candidatus Poseidoniaceae archaeon]
MEGRTRTLIVTLLVLFTATYVQVDLLDRADSSTLEEFEIASTIPLQTTHEWDIVSGNWYSIQTNCLSCTSELFINDVMIQSEQINYSGQINENGKLRIVIDNPQAENFAISAIVDVTDNHPNTRPGPQTEIQLSSVYHCNEPDHCIDKQSPILAGLQSPNQTIQSINGVLESQQKDHFGFAVTQGQTVELNLEHVNSDIEIKSYFQNETNEFEIVNNLTSDSTFNSKANPNLIYVNINEDGRLIISVSSETVDTIWSVGIIVYNQSQTSVIQLNEGKEILGHATKTIVIEMNDTTAINLQPNIFDVNYTYQSLVNSEWIFSGNGVFISDVDNFIFPLPGSTATMLTISANVFHIDLTSTNFDDINSGLEAPSLPPILASTNNSSWPVLDVQGPNRIGEFTHSVGDSSDVYRIEIDAWEDSIHFVKIDIEGDINAFEIELIEKDQNDWSEVESKTKTVTLGKLTVALELSRGTHFFRISMLNATTNTAWGEYSEPTKYTIITTYELVDEGEEPWFPPDENAKKWGNVARWVMGILFLVPALYLVIAQTRKKNYAKEMSSKKQRLQWLKSRLDEGISPKQNRRELAKSLDAVATLDWDDACQTWGEADIYYRTENVAIACWRLDPRIAEDSESWPIIVGIYIVSGSWEIAALRLDSPEGQAWEIKSVTPRFLHGGYEVFLDTMLEGNKTFLSLELVGSANSVDIELNGRLNGEPFACRAAKTLYRDEEE